MTGLPKAKHAATVILARTQHDGLEVFMTRRPRAMRFLGGAYVFPGGGVRKEDCAEAILKRCHGLSARQARDALGAELAPQLALGHWVAGIRELFEEVGVLLCATRAGKPVDMRPGELRQRLAEKRQGLIEGTASFLDLLETEELLCDASRLSYFSHWCPPEEFTTRFDTRFYVAPLPADQEPLATSQEVAHSLWISPERALKLCADGSLPMIFPTFGVLRALADFDSLESLFAERRLG